jgi:hypothetical protein
MDRIYILAAAIALAGALSGGLYSVSGSMGNAVMINRLTGSMWMCSLAGCQQTKFQISN